MSLSAVETLRGVESTSTAATAREWVRSHRWPLLIVVASIALLYARNFAKLFSDWSIDENYSHGFFVPIVFVWMLWRQRHELETVKVSPRWWGILVVLMALAQLAAGTMGAENFVAHTLAIDPTLRNYAISFLDPDVTARSVSDRLAIVHDSFAGADFQFDYVSVAIAGLLRLAAAILDLLRVPNVSLRWKCDLSG